MHDHDGSLVDLYTFRFRSCRANPFSGAKKTRLVAFRSTPGQSGKQDRHQASEYKRSRSDAQSALLALLLA